MKLPAEGIKNENPLLTLDVVDSELVSRIDKSIEFARPSYDKARTRAKANAKYWLGEQLELSKLKDYQAKIVNNIVFRNMETMLPIITQNAPLPKFLSGNKDFDRSMQKVLESRWQVHDAMLDKNRKAVRANFIELLGVLKYRWDEGRDDFVVEFVPTENVIFDSDASDVDSLGFVAEFISRFSLKEVIEKYPDKKAELLMELGVGEDDTAKLGAKLRYVEYHTPDFTVWKCGNVVLAKQRNPNWDWGNQKTTDDKGNQTEVTYNLWQKPRVPYIFFQTFNLGKGMYADTSLIEQTTKLQDGVNKRKRQISDNADNANGILAASGDGIGKDEFSKIDSESGLKIWVGSGDISRVLTRIPGTPLPGYVFDDMIHSEGAMDSIWGTHEITRGAGEANTATQDVMQQKADYGRIDDIVKAYEDFNEQYFQACFQMMLVHYTKPHVYSFDDEDDLEISRDSIIKEYSKTVVRQSSEIMGDSEQISEGNFRPPVIMVKRGSTLPTDDTTRRVEAMELAKAGKLADIDLFEKLDYPNPKETAYRVFLQASNPAQLYSEYASVPETQSSPGAISDYQSVSQGQEVPPNPEVQDPATAAAHIEAHNKMLDTGEFAQLDPSIQKMFVNHVKAEMEIAKSLTSEPAPLQ